LNREIDSGSLLALKHETVQKNHSLEQIMRYRSVKLATLFLASLLLSQSAFSIIIAEQDFNSLSSAFTSTTDSLPSGVQLTNAGSKNIGGPGLDFSTTWFDTRGVVLGPVTTTSDTQDFIGVNSFTGGDAPNVAPGGTAIAAGTEHNFEFNDGDGAVVLNFESVDVSGFTNRTLALDYWINDTGYESSPADQFTISISNGGLGIVLLGFGETELEANASADDGTDNWMSLLVDLDALLTSSGLDPTNLILSVAVDTNAATENIFIDNVRFESGAEIPAPAPLLMLALGLAGMAQLNRRKNARA
jgi:hypothetical protein